MGSTHTEQKLDIYRKQWNRKNAIIAILKRFDVVAKQIFLLAT